MDGVEERIASSSGGAALKAMFRARKEVFVDLLGWDLAVLGGQFEVDRFDDAESRYLILAAAGVVHRASTRLLRTDRPHLLGDLYPYLCAGPVPAGPSIREITRFCLDRHQRTVERRSARNQLVTALVEHALSSGITSYTGVAEEAWFEQILTFGWACEALGQPIKIGDSVLRALRIHIGGDTLERLRAARVYEPLKLELIRPFVEEASW